MFENYYNNVSATTDVFADANEKIEMYSSPIINTSLLIENLINMDKMSDSELFNMIKRSLNTLLNEIFKGNNSYDYLMKIVNSRFLNILAQVISSMEITYTQKIYCNKLAYDYLTLKNNDEYTKQIFFNLSRSVNRKSISLLSTLGLNEDLCAYISLARYSSEKEIVNVKRVNFILISAQPEIMTEQVITRIYEILFDNVTPLFEGIMFDSLSVNDEGEYDDDEYLIFSRIAIVILDILNNMTIPQIRQVLISYEGDRSICQQKARFEVAAISLEDYPRIHQVIDMLKTESVFVY